MQVHQRAAVRAAPRLDQRGQRGQRQHLARCGRCAAINASCGGHNHSVLPRGVGALERSVQVRRIFLSRARVAVPRLAFRSDAVLPAVVSWALFAVAAKTSVGLPLFDQTLTAGIAAAAYFLACVLAAVSAAAALAAGSFRSRPTSLLCCTASHFCRCHPPPPPFACSPVHSATGCAYFRNPRPTPVPSTSSTTAPSLLRRAHPCLLYPSQCVN
jgi:hypothetical protein